MATIFTKIINGEIPFENKAVKQQTAFVSDFPYFDTGATLHYTTNNGDYICLGVVDNSEELKEYYLKTASEEDIKETVIVTDSIIKVNDSIKIKVEHLDSIKNAKVIEVQTLDNDSTLKLFYKLVSE